MTSDAIATALRERLAFFVTDDSGERIVYGSEAGVLAALTPVVERLLAEQREPLSIALLQMIRTARPDDHELHLCSGLRCGVEVLISRASEAERRLREIAALRPRIVESLINDTLIDDPLAEPDDMPCECEDCGRLRIDALKAVLALLDTGAGQGEKT